MNLEQSPSIKVKYLGKVYEFRGQLRVEKLLKLLSLNPEEVLLIQGNRLIPPDEVLEGEVEIRPVISGG